MDDKILHLIGYACGSAGAEMGCHNGPNVLQQSAYLTELTQQPISYQWETLAKPESRSGKAFIQAYNLQLAIKVSDLVRQHHFFTVLGGDHSSAIGTWSGVYDACHQQGPLGLIWIDAHMDSHTPETTESGRIHGMPVATLLGYGYSELTSILHYEPKVQPEHLCLIGVRSFEKGEADLLEQLHVRVFFMDEVKHYGIKAILKEAITLVSKGTVGYGISIDIDSLDPNDAPAVDVPEPNGIPAQELCDALSIMANDMRCLGAEIAEFNPHHDKNNQTEQWIIRLLAALARQNAK
ncbi:MAG: hypothetical protein A3E84_01685 [Gammaproteobacteria bacterium RIFCSPHIGHO2_12_FULL_42_13]|nr:MAG: hypothetical protein A3E84_01685 [Gammaproteobacteria bacterium RIFCSPHIGHO2_12_FULL_42_13]